MNNKDKLGKIIRQRRLMIPLTLKQLSIASDVSISHISRIEIGHRFPSASILHKIADPLGFSENELFTLAGYLSAQPSAEAGKADSGLVDPYLAMRLSQELIEVQYAIIAILTMLKRVAGEYEFNLDFTEYARRRYPELDEDIITMIDDLLKRCTK